MKKYVTWAYFSVSATWNWRQPASATTSASERTISGGNATRTGRPSSYSVIVTTSRSAGAGRPVGDARSNPAKDGPSASAWVSCRARSARKFAWMIGSPSPRPLVEPVDDGRGDELVGLAAGVGRLDRLGRGRCAVAPPRRGRSRHSRARSGPSAGRGPSRSSDRRRVAIAAPGWAAASRISRSATKPSAEDGGVSRPSSRAWRRTAGTPLAVRQLGEGHEVPVVGVDAARPDQADDVEDPRRSHGACACDRGTPDGRRSSRRRSPRRCAAGPGARGGPAPRFRWPTSELPIWPGGSPTSPSDAPSTRVRPALEQAAPGRHRARRRSRRRRGRGRSRSRRGRRGRSGRGRRPAGLGHPALPRARAVIPARATMPAISSGLSEAPPTSAPSIAGSARNSPMFAEVTLPPYRTGTSAASVAPAQSARASRGSRRPSRRRRHRSRCGPCRSPRPAHRR